MPEHSGDGDRLLHRGDEGLAAEAGDPQRMLSRRSPLEVSRTGLVSRDYQPRTGGPELVASWPLGSQPGRHGEGLADWRLTDEDWVVLQRNFLQLPYLGPIDHVPIYLNAMGAARVEPGSTVTIELANHHLDGHPYEAAIELTNTEREPFMIPMVEVAPETTDHGQLGKEYGGYELRARVDGDVALIDPGTTVQLWRE